MTKQTLDIITAEPGSDMKHTGLYFTEGDEHLDLFTTDRHEAAHTGDTVWKGALTGDSRPRTRDSSTSSRRRRRWTLPDAPRWLPLTEGEGRRDPVADRRGRQ